MPVSTVTEMSDAVAKYWDAYSWAKAKYPGRHIDDVQILHKSEYSSLMHVRLDGYICPYCTKRNDNNDECKYCGGNINARVL